MVVEFVYCYCLLLTAILYFHVPPPTLSPHFFSFFTSRSQSFAKNTTRMEHNERKLLRVRKVVFKDCSQSFPISYYLIYARSSFFHLLNFASHSFGNFTEENHKDERGKEILLSLCACILLPDIFAIIFFISLTLFQNLHLYIFRVTATTTSRSSITLPLIITRQLLKFSNVIYFFAFIQFPAIRLYTLYFIIIKYL